MNKKIAMFEIKIDDVVDRFNTLVDRCNFKQSSIHKITRRGFLRMLGYCNQDFETNQDFVNAKYIYWAIFDALNKTKYKNLYKSPRNMFFARAYILGRILLEMNVCKKKDFPKVRFDFAGKPFSDTNDYNTLFEDRNKVIASRKDAYKRPSELRTYTGYNDNRKPAQPYSSLQKDLPIQGKRNDIRNEIKALHDNILKREQKNQEDIKKMEELYRTLEKKYDTIQKIQEIKERARIRIESERKKAAIRKRVNHYSLRAVLEE